MHIQNTGLVTSNGQYVLPLQSLQSQPIFVTSGGDGSANAVPNIQYQVIPQIQTADGQLGFSASTLDASALGQDGAGQIQILPDGSQAISVSSASDLLSNHQNLISQTGHVQQIQGVSLGSSAFGSQGQVVTNVPVGLPGNITFVPINSVDLDSLGLSGAQTIATGVTADGQLIMAGQPTDVSDGSDKVGEAIAPSAVAAGDPNATQDIFVPTTSAALPVVTPSSVSSQLPETIDGTGVLTQATAVSAGSEQVDASALDDSGFLQQGQQQNQVQGIQVSQAQPIIQLQQVPLQSGDGQLQVQGAGSPALQNVQLINPGTFLIQAQTVTPSGQIQWQTFQVQGVQNLQNLQLQTAPTQQITLAPVQTLSLGQGATLGSSPISIGSGQIPNLQTVTVNSVAQGTQFQQADETDSPGGNKRKKTMYTCVQ